MATSSVWKQLFQVSLTGPATQDTLYTPAAGVQAIIRMVRFANYSGGAVNVELWHGGTANANLIRPSTSIATNGVLDETGPFTTDENDTLYAEADTASAIVVTGYGVELS